jgi:Carboxypeptidase regulatory-like domain/TonB dependent receptor
MLQRPTSHSPLAFFVVTLIMLNSPTLLRADDLDNTRFEGVVRDSAGAVISGATVVALHTGTGVERSTLTSADGRYRISVNAPGDYKLKAFAAGFKDEERNQTEVTSGRTVTVDFAMSPAGVTEQVNVVSSAAPLIDTSRTVAGDTLIRRELEELPMIDRDPLQLVFLLGGVAEAPLSTSQLGDEGRGVFLRDSPEEAGSFSLTGAPATSNNITIDGLDNNDDRTARERITLNPESVSELQIITNQYAAEYGRASGGRINIRTRGGANGYKGEGYFFFGDESLNANTYFRNARGLGRIPQQQRREGALISGPIRKQKEFFFVSYERLDVPDSVEVNALVPVGTNPLFPLPGPNNPVPAGDPVGLFTDELSTPETRNLINTRVDLNFNPSRNGSVRLDLLRGENKRGFPGVTRLADTILIQGRNSDSISYTDNWIISNSIVHQGRFQYSRLLPRNKTDADSIGVIIKEPRLTAGSFTGSDASPAFNREERRIQIQDNLSIIRGNHLIKFGGDVQFIRSTFADLFAAGGEFTFDGVEEFLANQPSRFVQRFETTSRVENDVIGLFAQDEWRLRPNLTLSAGVRWDNETVLDDRRNFSPRMAIAWDPGGARLFRSFKRLAEPGKTVVRAGFGVFYNRALLRTIDDFSLGRTTTIVDSNISAALLSAVRFPQPITNQSLVTQFGVSETKFLRRVDQNIEIPYTIQSGLGIERQLGKKLVVTADYIYTRGAHLWRETNVNAPVLPSGFLSFTEYLASRDFDNRPSASGQRPVAGSNADIVRFDTGANTSTSSGAIKVENGLRVLTLGLNAPRSSNISAALNAIRSLRENPSLNEIELLESTGNSFYHGGIFSTRYALGRRVHFRAVYTLSKYIDEGTTNTASPQDLNDRRAERALSLQDQRHRISFSGLFRIPLLEVDIASIVSMGSSRPFNIGAGFDRNLNDIENDRPNFLADIGRPEWRRPGSAGATEIRNQLALAPIGSTGNLPRNYGLGPGTRAIDLRVSRSLKINERLRLRAAVDAFNVFNSTVFSFGSEFIDRDDADFLVPRRTQRPRSIQLSLKLSL